MRKVGPPENIGDVIDDVFRHRPRGGPWWGVVAVLLLVYLSAKAVVVVETGHRAVIFSKVSGVMHKQLGEGLHFNVPVLWEPSKYDVRKQTYTMSATPQEGQVKGDDSLVVLTDDGLPVWLDMSVVFHIDPLKVWQLHQDIGPEYVDKIVRPEARSEIRMVFAQYPVIDVYSQKRAEIVEKARERLSQRMSRSHLLLDELLLRNVKFSDSFQSAIERKQVAQQEAKRMDYVLQQAELERQRKVVEAEGEAEAIRLRADALARNPDLVRYEYVQSLPDNVRVMVADANTIINMADVLKPGAGR